MLIIAIASHQIEAGNLGSQSNNKKYGEKDERETCQPNLYPITSHGSYKSQFQIWPLFLQAIFLQTSLHHLHHLLS
jgi:hypothetical protein